MENEAIITGIDTLGLQVTRLYIKLTLREAVKLSEAILDQDQNIAEVRCLNQQGVPAGLEIVVRREEATPESADDAVDG